MAWSWEGAAEGAGTGSQIGAAAGTLIPIPGFSTLVGGTIGAGVGALIGGVKGGDPMEAALQRAAQSLMTVDAREKYIDATQRTQSQVAQKAAYNEAVKQRNQAGASGWDASNQQELARHAGYESASTAATEGEVARKARQDQVMAGLGLGKELLGFQKAEELARIQRGDDPHANIKQFAQYAGDKAAYDAKLGSATLTKEGLEKFYSENKEPTWQIFTPATGPEQKS